MNRKNVFHLYYFVRYANHSTMFTILGENVAIRGEANFLLFNIIGYLYILLGIHWLKFIIGIVISYCYQLGNNHPRIFVSTKTEEITYCGNDYIILFNEIENQNPLNFNVMESFFECFKI